MSEITPAQIIYFVVCGVFIANIFMYLTNRAVAWYRRTGGIIPLYIAGTMLAISALIVLSPLMAIKPPQ